jgi:VIT family
VPSPWGSAAFLRFELGLEEPDPRRAFRSALTIGGAYIAGALVPLLPYMLLRSVQGALPVSILLTLVTLFVFGAVDRCAHSPRRRADSFGRRARRWRRLRDRADGGRLTLSGYPPDRDRDRVSTESRRSVGVEWSSMGSPPV